MDLCENYLDDNGTVYPITEEESNGYLTTGYTKNGQYTYHNQCKAAMTSFYASDNKEHSWTFRKGINTNPDGFTSTSYYDLLDDEGESIKCMDSKIEDGFYVIEDDKASVVKYFVNCDVQYRAWMKTTSDGEWVYGRDKGPDIINYSYGSNGYQQKDIYWYNEAGTILKRKYFDDSGNTDFCHYYYSGGDYESVDACIDEATKDAEFGIE